MSVKYAYSGNTEMYTSVNKIGLQLADLLMMKTVKPKLKYKTAVLCKLL